MKLEEYKKNIDKLQLEGEVWKDIEGFEGDYQISNIGRVKALNYKGKKNNYHILSLSIDKVGYHQIILKKKNFTVHRLVAMAFIPNPNEYKEINHKDGIKYNNNVENLEWCTRSHNIQHAFDMGLKINKKGSESYQAKEVYKYGLDGRFLGKYGSIVEASPNDDVLRSNISACCKGKIKTAGGYIWSYKFEEIDVKAHEADLGYPVYQYDIDGKFLKKYENAQIAADETKIDHSNICSVCRGERLSTGGYIWSYKYELLEPNEILSKRHAKVYQFDRNGNLIKEWNSVKEASQSLQINSEYIRACCNGTKKIVSGYIWSYDSKVDYLKHKAVHEREIEQYTLDGEFIKTFSRIIDASKELNINRRNISAACCGTRKTAGGYIWKYKK